MTIRISGDIKLSINAKLENVLELSTPKDSLAFSLSSSFTDGTGLDKAQIDFHDERTIPNGTYEEINLVGTLISPIGGICNFTKIKGLMIAPAVGSVGNYLQVGMASTNPFAAMFGSNSDSIKVEAGGFIAFHSPGDGYGASLGNCKLKVSNLATATQSYKMVVLGEGTLG